MHVSDFLSGDTAIWVVLLGSKEQYLSTIQTLLEKKKQNLWIKNEWRAFTFLVLVECKYFYNNIVESVLNIWRKTFF